jgi:hypothetical protein
LGKSWDSESPAVEIIGFERVPLKSFDDIVAEGYSGKGMSGSLSVIFMERESWLEEFSS